MENNLEEIKLPQVTIDRIKDLISNPAHRKEDLIQCIERLEIKNLKLEKHNEGYLDIIKRMEKAITVISEKINKLFKDLIMEGEMNSSEQEEFWNKITNIITGVNDE